MKLWFNLQPVKVCGVTIVLRNGHDELMTDFNNMLTYLDLPYA